MPPTCFVCSLWVCNLAFKSLTCLMAIALCDNQHSQSCPESTPCSMQALTCIARLVKGLAPHQAKLGDARVATASGAGTPALQAILQVTAILPLTYLCDPSSPVLRTFDGHNCMLCVAICTVAGPSAGDIMLRSSVSPATGGSHSI